MALCSNIVRRGATYYLRVAVPADLQVQLSKREIWRSLRTKETREARRKGAEALAELHAAWDAKRNRIELSPAELHGAAVELYRSELALDDRRRAALPTADNIAAEAERVRAVASSYVRKGGPLDEFTAIKLGLDFLSVKGMADHDAHARRVLLDTLRSHVAQGETALVTWAADQAIESGRLNVEKGSADYRRLCQTLARSWMEALERQAERDRGNFAGAPSDPVLKSTTGATGAVAVAARGESVEELFEVYSSENPRGIRPDTLRMARDIVGWFSSYAGKRFPASSIDKKAVREWKALLRRFPVKAAEIADFQGLPMRKIVERNEASAKPRPTLSTRTVNKYLSGLGAFCHWLMQHGYLDVNPVDGMHTRQDKDRTHVVPYTSDQLNRIFSSPLFTGHLSPEQPHKPGHLVVRDHRFWLPLLSLFSGARLGELGQLLTADVREVHGRWIIHITRLGGEGKSTKTKGSQRVIPLHPELVRLGFLDYHSERVTAGDARLFPAVTTNDRDQVAGDMSRGWGRYLVRIGIKTDRRLNFHSFRHGFADALRRAGYRDEEFGFLLGHTSASTTGRYGILPEGELSQRVAMVEAVAYPNLDLGALMPSLKLAA